MTFTSTYSIFDYIIIVEGYTHSHLIKEGILRGIAPNIYRNTLRESLDMVEPEGRHHQHIPWTNLRNNRMSSALTRTGNSLKIFLYVSHSYYILLILLLPGGLCCRWGRINNVVVMDFKSRGGEFNCQLFPLEGM